MAGKFALIIGNSQYDDSSLSRLRAPDVDVKGLEGVLKDPEVGRFDEVTTLLNEGCASARKAIARFYDQRRRDDLLLLYFSGHGVKDEQGHLYLALRDTECLLLAGTAIESAFITGRMDRSFSKRQVLVLDCCHSGAFAYGAKAAHGVSVGTAEAFEGTGFGRVILTATDSTQYAWEGDQIIGDAQSSLFTHFLVEGLKTGAADRDQDGVVTVDELYDYVREQVVNATPRQTPYKWTYRQEGDIVLAQNPFLKTYKLPPEIQELINSKLSSLRLEAVRDLAILLRGRHAGRARAALAALKDLSLDDSRKVANAAREALSAYDEKAEAGKAAGPLAVSATAAVPLDDEQLRALNAEVEQAAVHEAAWRQAEAPATPDDRIDALTSDIFISYAHEDRDKASALAQVLAARGWAVWWDRRIAPGEAYDVVIERQLSICKCAVVLWSANSVNATWVRNEARRARRRRVLVPILIEAVETPLEFENLQTADLTSWDGTANHPELAAVCERIQALSPIPYERLERKRAAAARRDAEARREAEVARREAEAARREAEAAKRQRELAIERARIEEIIERERAAAALREAEIAERQRALAAGQAHVEDLVLREERGAPEHPQIFSRSTSRKVQVAVAALVALMAVIWFVWIWRGRPPAARQPSQSRNLPNALVAENARPAPQRESQAPKPPPAAAAQATPGSVPQMSAAPKSTEIAESQQASPSKRLDDLRTRARVHAQSGQREQALNAVVAGLQIDPKDSALRNLLDSMLRDAQAGAERSKQEAEGFDASARTEDVFNRGAQKEQEAAKLRQAGRVDAAIRAYWAAANRFAAAAAESKQLIEEEARARAAPPPPPRPPVNQPAERKLLNTEVEQELVMQTLRQYERAYADLRADRVRSVYPSAPIDQLTKEFADYRSYKLTLKVTDLKFFNLAAPTVFVTVMATRDIVSKSGQPIRSEGPQTVTLEKPAGSWIIVNIR